MDCYKNGQKAGRQYPDTKIEFGAYSLLIIVDDLSSLTIRFASYLKNK